MAENKAKSNGIGCVTLLVLYALCVGVYQGWLWLDREGYRSHTVNSTITAQENWMPGETKLCASAPFSREESTANGKPEGYVFERIACDDGPDHNVKIEFYGEESQLGVKYSVYWSCTRNEISAFNDNAFVCKQTGGM